MVDEDALLEVISLKEVSQHSSPNDIWIVIFNKVFNVTEFIKEHPGGSDIMLEYGGRDATLAFLGSGHSQDAFDILKDYCIGVLPKHEVIPALNQEYFNGSTA
eukprot:TRINITY_DN7545_c0_g1_i1.p1 TRINITY_DN7545_c0_g1~~TRINITY_DN7545_c0_g1_i1.p1  ORF type:complete len:103 (+),score=24.23 TRINITY_DN7545_c0_g1_i1:137-445(+)